MSETPSFDTSPEQDAAIEGLADKRGISFDMARRAFFGTRIEPDGPVAAPKTPQPHYSHRGGRSYEGISGADVSRMIANEDAAGQPPVSAEDRAEHKAVLEAALDETMGKDRHLEAIKRKVEQRIPIDPDNVTKSLEARKALETALVTKHFEDKAAS